jgi:hypothetical protein
MLGLSYGEVFLILGATIAVIGGKNTFLYVSPSFLICFSSFKLLWLVAGPKDVPRVARAAGRLAGRAVGYVQSARGQMEHILHQSQANQVCSSLASKILSSKLFRLKYFYIS